MLASWLAEAAGGLDPVAAGHPQVHQHDVRPKPDRERERLVAVGCGADDLDAGEQAEQGCESFADDPLVVGDQDADRCRSCRHPQLDPESAAGGAGGERAAEQLGSLRACR